MLRPAFENIVEVAINIAPPRANEKSLSLTCFLGLNRESKKTPKTIESVPKAIIEFILSPKNIIAKIVPNKGIVAKREEVSVALILLTLSKLSIEAKPGARIPATIKKGMASFEGIGDFTIKTNNHKIMPATKEEMMEFNENGFLWIPFLIIVAFNPIMAAEMVANIITSILF